MYPAGGVMVVATSEGDFRRPRAVVEIRGDGLSLRFNQATAHQLRDALAYVLGGEV